MHFLVIDNRFGVPIYVFLERDTMAIEGNPSLPGRWVTLEPAIPIELRYKGPPGHGFATQTAIGRDPQKSDRFAEFPCDGDVRAAGFALIEPRYVGPSWETYLSVFHPEGGKRSKLATSRARSTR